MSTIKKVTVLRGDTVHYEIIKEEFETIKNKLVALENTNVTLEMQPEIKSNEHELVFDGIVSSNYVGVVR
jgi:hypothetical protein